MKNKAGDISAEHDAVERPTWIFAEVRRRQKQHHSNSIILFCFFTCRCMSKVDFENVSYDVLMRLLVSAGPRPSRIPLPVPSPSMPNVIFPIREAKDGCFDYVCL